MAIGDGFNNSNNGGSFNGSGQQSAGKIFENTFYSRVRFKGIDNSLSMYYRAGLMCIEIYTMDPGTYKSNPLGNVFLSPMKANMLVSEIKKFKEYLNSDDIKENVAFGVNAGMGEKVSYIGFHTNKNKDIIITIGKFDDNGQIVESHNFTFMKDYNYSLEWTDISRMELDKVFHNGIELDILANAIADFGRSMSGAAAYATVDLNRYEHARILRKIDPIYDKLGIDRKYGGNGGGTNNFLNNASSSSRSTSIDEVEDLLE